MLSSGGLSELSSPALRTALVRYHEVDLTHLETGTIVLQRVSAPHDGYHAALYVNPDYEPGGSLLYKYDWSKIEGTREQFQVQIYGKLSLSGEMEDLISRGETVLLEIEAAQK